LKTESTKVVNKLGIHARPAAQIVKTASKFDSDIELTVDGITVNAKSIMGVMTLAACRGTEVRVTARGKDEDEAVDALIKLLESGFGED